MPPLSRNFAMRVRCQKEFNAAEDSASVTYGFNAPASLEMPSQPQTRRWSEVLTTRPPADTIWQKDPLQECSLEKVVIFQSERHALEARNREGDMGDSLWTNVFIQPLLNMYVREWMMGQFHNTAETVGSYKTNRSCNSCVQHADALSSNKAAILLHWDWQFFGNENLYSWVSFYGA